MYWTGSNASQLYMTGKQQLLSPTSRRRHRGFLNPGSNCWTNSTLDGFWQIQNLKFIFHLPPFVFKISDALSQSFPFCPPSIITRSTNYDIYFQSYQIVINNQLHFISKQIMCCFILKDWKYLFIPFLQNIFNELIASFVWGRMHQYKIIPESVNPFKDIWTHCYFLNSIISFIFKKIFYFICVY